MTQFGPMGGHENSYEYHAIFGGGNNIGVDGELFVPPLETIKLEESVRNENYTFDRNTNTINPYSNMSNLMNNCNNNNKVDNKAEVGNCWVEGEEDLIRVGEWDLEELMRDVSSFPLLDFQVQ